MCGIIAYSGNENAGNIITQGLKKLEYRGYDSAGITVFRNDKPVTVKTQGRVYQLERKSEGMTDNTFCGIGHTRWATHGKPSETNAHPHTTELISLVHNGIIENYTELKEKLIKKDYSFRSETDTEVAASLLDDEYRKFNDPIKSIISLSEQITGSYAICIIFKNIPDCVFAIKQDSPLILGKNKNGNFIASDISAFSAHTDTFYRMNDGEIAKISKNRIELYNSDGENQNITWEKSDSISSSDEDKKNFRHFMIKEINDEPEALLKTFSALTKNSLPCFPTIPDSFFNSLNRIHITACGTAYHAGLIGKYYIEKLTRIPVNIETAGEFRYSDPLIEKNDAVIVISQSGETADTLAALRAVRQNDIPVIAIVNSHASTIETESDYVVKTHAGREVSVASTKAFSVQILALLIFASKLAMSKNKLSENECRTILSNAEHLFTNVISKVITDDKQILRASQRLSKADNIFFTGRGYDFRTALEGSLKLKEITYINSQGYPAAEMKHGTISLIEKNTPVVVIATDKMFFKKIRSNIEEMKSRGAFIISLCPEDAEIIKEISDIAITVPVYDTLLYPFTTAAVIQLIAYHTADIMGRDIDKPRNLAKSVTVE